MQRITSRHNPLVARCRAIVRGDEPDLLLLDGAHLVAEAIAAGLRVHEVVVFEEALDREEMRRITDLISLRHIVLVSGSASVMDAISPVRSRSALVAIADKPTQKHEQLYAPGPALVAVAVDVQDPGNLGAIARVAEAAGASGFVAAGQSADPFGWKALRGSMGSALRLPIAVHARADDAVAEARRHGCRIVAASPKGGHSLFDADLIGPVAILVGAEGAGLPESARAAAELNVTIPMAPPVESLNAAVAAALLLYEARRRRAKGANTGH
jgi:TrmH family RNA methyltransferase